MTVAGGTPSLASPRWADVNSDLTLTAIAQDDGQVRATIYAGPLRRAVFCFTSVSISVCYICQHR